MARNVQKLTEEENKFFHLNYDYMWQKLNTAPYYVCGAGECPNWIRNSEELPSYVNLSKCRNHSFVPSMTIVNKIVKFYNYNLTPEVTTFQFLREDLSITDIKRSRNTSVFDDRFLGTYYGYYYDDSEEKKIVGAMINIFEENQMLRVRAITGINSQDELYGNNLKKLFNREIITTTAYKKYHDSLDISQRGITYYEGAVEVTPRFLVMAMKGIDREDKQLAITLSIESFVENKEYISGLSFSVLISDKHDIQFFMFGLSRADRDDLIPLDFDNETIKNILHIQKKDNEHIIMSANDDRKWYNLVVNNGK